MIQDMFQEQEGLDLDPMRKTSGKDIKARYEFRFKNTIEGRTGAITVLLFKKNAKRAYEIAKEEYPECKFRKQPSSLHRWVHRPGNSHKSKIY